MSNNDEEPYSTIFASLKHPVRRKILRMLSNKPMSFSEMLEVLGVSNSFLTYHLENLGELVGKMDDGRYRLSSFGEDAMATMIRVEDIPVNTPHQSPQTKPKKIVWKSVPIALGLICIVLIAFIAYFAVAGISAQNSYNNLKNQNNNLQNQNRQLQAWLDGNETQLNQTQANNTSLENQIDSLNSNITSLQGKVNNLTDILNLNQSTTMYDGPLTIFADTLEMTTLQESAPYAGYATVQVSSSRINQNIIIIVVWDYYPTLRYQSQFDLGSNGTAIFPVMPTSMFVYFSTQNSTETANVTITYYY